MNDIELKIEAAPHGESLERIRDRLLIILLQKISDKHDQVKAICVLNQRSFSGDQPNIEEWRKHRDDLARARDLARDLALALALALDLARDLALALDLARDLALALDRDLDLDQTLVTLLGDRLDPYPNIDAAILSAIDVEKLFGLEMHSWHCGTTHCRAGSAIHIHPMGYELEKVFGSRTAGAVIYLKSTGRVPDFFASNHDAMANIRKCAAEQVGK